jgi:signal transduction histidine kinase
MAETLSKQIAMPTAAADAATWYLRAMERLVGVVQQISLARDLPSLMAIVRDAARELTGADGATFILRDGDRCFYADENAIAPLWKGRKFPIEACISGWAMLNRREVVIEDIYADARIPHDAYRPTFVSSLLVVPIRTLDPVGAIGNYWAKRRRPTAEEVKLLQALADTTAVAMENVRVYEELETRVRERTADLEAANRELDSFSYSVSHDLRAPVRAVAGFCDLLVQDHRDEMDDEARRKVGIIQTEAARMGSLIEDLLALSRLGRRALRCEDVDMDALARRVLDRLRAETPGTAAEVELGTLPRVHGDASLLEQVWTNLLSNALKFSSKRPHPWIEIGGEASANEATYFVRDNGAGFDPRYADRMFKAFQRLHDEREFPGTGVGLALSHRIVARHGGRLSATGVPGGGATFTFTLPIVATPT